MGDDSIGSRDTEAASGSSRDPPRVVHDPAGMHDTLAASGGPHQPPPAREARSAFEFTRGSLIDRYVVLERLGAGGMGIVYAAYDPELRRRVALKLLLVDVGTDQARLLREARAIARLAHPNVVTVYDVGTFESRVYVTMEYVDGQTLRQWWAAAPRPWTEILAVFMNAAHGLSAAHAAGLVHRDFKPENVLIGKDGRVRVLDFGLARRAAGVEISAVKSFASVVVPGTDVFRLEISGAGALVGTPAYMAPEQFADGTVDHRADQFAFCVALFEGLLGRRPFRGDTAIEMITAISSGNFDFGDTRRVPGALIRVLRRGLAVRADQRYPSMDELARALGRARTARRDAVRRGLAVGGLAVAAGLYGYLGVLRPAAETARCHDAGQRITEVWNVPRADTIDAALVATGLAYARDTGPLVRAQLDRHVRAWQDAHASVCDELPTPETRPQLHARLACLDENLANLRTAVEIFAEADAQVAEYAVQAASALPAPDRCIAAPGHADEADLSPETATDVQRVRDLLSRIRVEGDAGRRTRARELAREAVALADAAGHPPIQAEARLHLGLTELAAGDLAAAEHDLRVAYDQADRAGVDPIRAAAATHLIKLGHDIARMTWATIALAAIHRIGAPPQLLVERYANRAAAHAIMGRYDQAIVDYQTAIFLDGDVPSYRTAELHTALGAVHSDRHDYRAAVAAYDRSISLGAAMLGPRHRQVARWVINRAWSRLQLGSTALARADYSEAITLFEAANGPVHLSLAYPLNGLGGAALAEGDFTTAAASYRRMRKVLEQTGEPDDSYLITSDINLAETMTRAGDPAEAVRLGERALAHCARAHGVDHERCGHVEAVLSHAHVLSGRPDLAAPLAARALATRERVRGADDSELRRPLLTLGMIATLGGRPGEALPLLERALVLAQTVWEDPLEHAELRLALADTLWQIGDDRPRSRQLALEVETRLRMSTATAGQTAALTRVDAWLLAHPLASP